MNTDTPTGSPAVKNMFSSIAGRYDAINRLLSLGIDVRWRRELVSEAPHDPGEPVLDLATGTGDVVLALAGRGKAPGAIVGADFALPMLKEARRKTRRAGQGNIRLLGADAHHLPFASGYFGAVTMAFGLRNIPDRVHAMAEMNRVLAPGGKLLVLEFSKVQQPLVGPLYRLYFHHVLPWLGGLLSGNHGAYRYLPRSVDDFPDPLELAGEMFQAGFDDVKYRPLTFGIACLHVAQKDEQPFPAGNDPAT